LVSFSLFSPADHSPWAQIARLRAWSPTLKAALCPMLRSGSFGALTIRAGKRKQIGLDGIRSRRSTPANIN